MTFQDLVDEFYFTVNDEIHGLPITLGIPKLIILTTEFMKKAYDLGKSEK